MSRIALVGKNSIEYIRILLDIWNSGNCAVLIDYRIPFETAFKMMREAEVATCYVEKNIYEVNNGSGIEVIVYERKSDHAELLPIRIYDSFNENYSKNEAVVIYSSGTTGNSKGIILSHYALNTNADAIIDYMKPKRGDCIYIVKSLTHSSTLTGELLVALKSRMNLVVTPADPHPRQIIKNTNKFNVTILCLNPTLLSMLADEYLASPLELPTLHKIYSSGSVLTDRVYEKAHRAFENKAVYNVYGLSEAGPRVSAQTEYCCKSNSVGRPLSNVEVVIVDEYGKKLSCNEKGVIHVKTPSCYDGYISGKEKYSSLYRQWLNTGDIGYFDENDELHIVNRIDDVIIVDSHKIYPRSITDEILVLEMIDECVILSVFDKSKEKNEMVCFYSTKSSAFSSENIRRNLLRTHPRYEIPNKFICVPSLPLNSNGKVDKEELIKYYFKS